MDREFLRMTRRMGHEFRQLSVDSRQTGSLLGHGIPAALAPVRSDVLDEWAASICGPANSPYDGIFVVRLKVPKAYPIEPPQLRFMTTIYHPNVRFQDGEINLDLLRDRWSPALALETLVVAVFSLMVEPQFEQGCWPQDSVMQTQIALGIANRTQWEKQAAAYSKASALPSRLPFHKHSFAVFLCWVGKQIADRVGSALLQTWMEHVVPGVMLERLLLDAIKPSDAHEASPLDFRPMARQFPLS